MAAIQLEADIRNDKTASLRKKGAIPAVVYGKNIAPIPIQLDGKNFIKLFRKNLGKNQIIALKIRKDSEIIFYTVLAHDFQIDPILDQILHIDFLKIAMEEEIKTKIPILIIGEAQGVKLEGGILFQALRYIEVKCLPADIPEKIDIDVTPLKIGHSIHVSDLAAPKGVTIITAKTESIATVTSPTKEEEEAPKEEAAVVAGAEPAAGAAAPEASQAEGSQAKTEAKAAPQDAKAKAAPKPSK